LFTLIGYSLTSFLPYDFSKVEEILKMKEDLINEGNKDIDQAKENSKL